MHWNRGLSIDLAPLRSPLNAVLVIHAASAYKLQCVYSTTDKQLFGLHHYATLAMLRKPRPTERKLSTAPLNTHIHSHLNKKPNSKRRTGNRPPAITYTHARTSTPNGYALPEQLGQEQSPLGEFRQQTTTTRGAALQPFHHPPRPAPRLR